MPSTSGRIVLAMFIAGAIVGGLASCGPEKGLKDGNNQPNTCGEGTGNVAITVQSSAPGVDCPGVVLHVSSDGSKKDNVTWKLPGDNSVTKFEVDFSSGYCDTASDTDVPFTKDDGSDKPEFTEAKPNGTVKDLCKAKKEPYCICYYKYTITIDNDPNKKYDPGVIITKP